MTVTIPSRVRLILYVLTVLGTPVVGVLVDQNIWPSWVGVLWSAEVAAVGTLAASNVTPDK